MDRRAAMILWMMLAAMAAGMGMAACRGPAKGPGTANTPAAANAPAAAGTVTTAAAATPEARLEAVVRALTGTEKPRHYKNPAVLDAVAADLGRRMTASGFACREQVFTARGQTFRNVVCAGGAAPEQGVWVVGAHYDVWGDFPGADDNASGVAGLVELAHRLGPRLSTLPFHLELVAYANEEPPFFRTPDMGSAHHAKDLKRRAVPVRGMICLEMIGFFSEEDLQQAPVEQLKFLLPKHANFIAAVANPGSAKLAEDFAAVMNQAGRLQAIPLAIPASVKGADFSDHMNYWNEGFLAVMITDTAFFRNPHYHKATDTPDTLDYAKMAAVVEGVEALLNK